MAKGSTSSEPMKPVSVNPRPAAARRDRPMQLADGGSRKCDADQRDDRRSPASIASAATGRSAGCRARTASAAASAAPAGNRCRERIVCSEVVTISILTCRVATGAAVKSLRRVHRNAFCAVERGLQSADAEGPRSTEASSRRTESAGSPEGSSARAGRTAGTFVG